MAVKESSKKKGRPTPRNLFSFSRVKAFAQCAARYRYRYLKGHTEAFQSIEAYLGSTAHAVLEWLYAQREESSTPSAAAARAELERRWHEGWSDEIAIIRRSDRADAHLAAGLEMITRYHDHTLSRDMSSTVALEMRLSRKLSSGVTLTGFADRIGRTAKGRLFVVDYKTSKSLGDASELSEGLQAPLYAACALERWNESEALAGYHYLRHATTRWRPVSREQGAAVLTRFEELVEQARSATTFPASPSVLCAWCGFNHLCPDARVPEELRGGQELALRVAGADGAQKNARL